ncbi:MAG: NAD(P)/FAD-dependent oxidoreductase [Fusobacteriaceae bacterium]|jgi:uncharacterized FAD-dependent dehydrogenase|nr:NAD(P)/FAD-dependent oxidoreductase [Fusobacteriaceae bacterium]
MKINVNNIIIPVNKEQNSHIYMELDRLGIKKENIENIIWNKRSIDSRQKREIKFIYNLQITLKTSIDLDKYENISLARDEILPNRIPKNKGEEIVIIGCGPAGLFAALRLAEYGYIPIIYEMGEEVDQRDKSTENFVQTSTLNTFSNIQFGEGGAGTYSDGKLNTRIRSEYIDKVFNEFTKCGANKDILWDYRPHIGTDILKIVVKNLREKIKSLGGIFNFNSKVENIIIKNDEINGIEVLSKNKAIEKIYCKNIILAIGHSARDTYKMLYRNKIKMESKPFAIGMRIEHLQSDINKMQYGKFANYELLPPATYAFTYNDKIEKRGTFTFCMCPGGEIINATSEYNKNLVNGMSNSDRAGKFANSALVVGIKEKDFGNDIFSLLKFQEDLEAKTFDIVSEYGAIYQNTIDFMKNTKTKSSIDTSYKMKLTSFRTDELFPEYIVENMKKALLYWNKNDCFIGKNINLIGPETRTSAPVRILRNKTGESLNIKGLYPVGEGAGYAGGITSSAVDGIKIVDLNFTEIKE